MQTLEKFLDGRDVCMRCREVKPNTNQRFAIIQSWAEHQYSCELHGSNGARPVRAIMGSDTGPPEMPEVLDAVAAEAAVVDEAEHYEQWAVQMGFDPDSRSGERVYRTARRQAKLLRGLLGDEAYEQLLWKTERL